MDEIGKLYYFFTYSDDLVNGYVWAPDVELENY